jgi:trehalose/maltose transport system substrate-binding protein
VLVERGWFDKEFRDVRDRELGEFTAQTGIRVKLLPGSESAIEQLRLWQRLLGDTPETKNVHPDVFGIDVIWPGILADDLLDLKPYVAEDVSAHFPELVANMTVNGRLVALPSRLDLGLLYYRTDLLQRYGYHAPPETWEDLEKMAARIQQGERARGKKNFWGFAWEGATTDTLTSNALEWQASEGGGHIIEADGKVTVNSARAIKSWERAAGWVGSISPLGVTTYKEQDAMNLWLTGDAAFMRNWWASYVVSGSDRSAVKNKFAVTLLPRGNMGRAEVFGGDGYSVSRRSAHPKEAIALVRYLCSRKVEALRARMLSTPPTMPDLYQDAELSKENPHLQNIRQAVLQGLVARPSTVAGPKYFDVSEAYTKAVHSVLMHEKNGAAAATELEQELRRIIGSDGRSPSGVPPRTASIPHAPQ